MSTPAFLFYSADFQIDTEDMSDEQVGKYIRLLCRQHLKGHIEEKHMLNICKTHDKDIFAKFVQDENGFYFNKRLEKEIAKRQKYSHSRAANRAGKKISNAASEKPIVITTKTPDEKGNTPTIDPFTDGQRRFTDAYKKVFDKKPLLSTSDIYAMHELSGQFEDFYETIPEVLEKTKDLDFNGYKPSARWILQEKNYTDVRNGVYDNRGSPGEYTMADYEKAFKKWREDKEALKKNDTNC